MLMLARRVAETVADKQNIIAIDLANEIDVICPDVDPRSIAAWTGELAAAIREARPGTVVTNGSAVNPMFANSPWTYSDQKVDFVCMHGYPQFRTPLPIERGGAVRSSLVFGAMTAYAGSFAPVMRQEFGTAMGGDSEIFGDLIRAGTVASWLAGSNGFLYWCWRDFTVRELPYAKHPFESSLGYADPDGNSKVWSRGYDEACRLVLQHAGFRPSRSPAAIYLPGLGKGGGGEIDAALAACYENLVGCQLNPRFASEFPHDAELVVMPVTDLGLPGIDELRQYLEGGGRAIVLGLNGKTASRGWEELTGARQCDFLRMSESWTWTWEASRFELPPVFGNPMPLMAPMDDDTEVIARLDDDPIILARTVGRGRIVQTPLPLANAACADLDPGIVGAWQRLMDVAGYEAPIRAASPYLQTAVVQNAAGERRLIVINHAGQDVEDTLTIAGECIHCELPAKGIASLPLP